MSSDILEIFSKYYPRGLSLGIFLVIILEELSLGIILDPLGESLRIFAEENPQGYSGINLC